MKGRSNHEDGPLRPHKYSSVSFVKDNCVSVGNSVGSNPLLASRENTFQVRSISLVSWQIRCVSLSCVNQNVLSG